MVFCKECGSKVDDNAKFCKECGTNTSETTPQIQPKDKHKNKPKNEKNLNKKKIQIILIVALVLVSIIITVIFTVPISGTAIEVSSIAVPYETQEAYTVQEPYTVYVDKELGYAVLTATNYNNLDGLNWMTYGQITIKNVDDISGMFIIHCYFRTVDGILSDENGISINSGESRTSICSADIHFGQDVVFTYNILAPTTKVPVTKYKDVTKYKTITKYKLEDQETEVPRSATLYERWTKQVQWYYRVESDVLDIIDGEILIMRDGEIINTQNSNMVPVSNSIINQATTTLTQQNTKNIEPEITVERLQNIISKSPEFNNLKDGSKIVITFFDGNGLDIPNTGFTITGGGKVTTGIISDYDIKLSTGSYYIPKIELSDNICSALNKISRDDVRVNLQGNKLKLFFKYSSLKDCVPF